MERADAEQTTENCYLIVEAIKETLATMARDNPKALTDASVISAFGMLTADMLQFTGAKDPRAAIALFGAIVELHFAPENAHEAPERP